MRRFALGAVQSEAPALATAELTSEAILTLSTSQRDETLWPSASSCSVNLPIPFEGVRSVKLMSAEFPHVANNLTLPKLYFSEKQNGVHRFYLASMPSAGYDTAALTSAVTIAMASAVCVNDAGARPSNVYALKFSTDSQRCAILSTGGAEFCIHFRTDPIEVVSCSPAVEGAEYLQLTVKDKQSPPVSAGAIVTFRNDMDYRCIVTDAGGNTIIVKRLDAEVISTDPSTGVKTYAQVPQGAWTLTLVPGATLIPDSSIGENLGAELGFGTLRDYSSKDTALSVQSVSPPLATAISTVQIVTSEPHFFSVGSSVVIQGTDTFMDGAQTVTSVSDPYAFGFVPDSSTLLNGAPDLVMDNGDVYSIVSSTVQSVTNGVMTALIDTGADTTNAVGRTFTFAVTSTSTAAQYNQFLQASGTVLSQSGPTGFVANVVMPSRPYTSSLTAANVTYVNPAVLAAGRYDLSRGKRFVLLELKLDDRPIGNVYSPALNTKLFARLPLPDGRDFVNFLREEEVQGEATPSLPAAKVRSIGLTVYDENGVPYDFAGTDYSITLRLIVTSPLQ